MVFIPLIYFSSLFALFFYRHRHWGMDLAGSLLLMIISLCAILIDMNDLYGDYGINEYSITLPTIFLFCLQWTLVLLPIHHISDLNFHEHPPIKNKLVYALIVVVTLSSLVILINSLTAIRDAIIMDAVDVRNEHYKNLQQGIGGSGNYLLVIPSILTNNPFPTLALFLWFYTKAFMKVSIYIRAGIFVASVLQAIIAITISGRAAMVYWAFDFFLIYSFFYRFISFKTKLSINIICGILGGAATILFLSITFSRFDSGAYSPLDSLYGYAGQHINNFCTMIVEGGNTPLLTDRIFPLYTKIVYGTNFDMYEHYQTLTSSTNAIVNVFDTFGGEIFLDLGWIGYILSLIGLFLFYIIVKARLTELDFYHIFLITVITAFFSHGLFAWPFTTYYTTYALFLIAISYFLFKYEYRI